MVTDFYFGAPTYIVTSEPYVTSWSLIEAAAVGHDLRLWLTNHQWNYTEKRYLGGFG